MLATGVLLASTALPAVYLPTGIGVVACAYTVATRLPRRPAITALAIGLVMHAIGGIATVALGGHVHPVITYWANDGCDAIDLLLASVGTFAIPGLIGLYVQATRTHAGELAARLEAERELRAEAAAAEERAAEPSPHSADLSASYASARVPLNPM